MPTNTLTCLGVGDGLACPDRYHSAFLYRLGRTRLLVDCGEPVCRNLCRLGLDSDAVDAVLLSHLHADHFGGFFMLLQGLWLEGRRKALPVYMPGTGIGPVRALLRAATLYERLFPFRVRFEAWRAGRPVRVGDARVTPFPTTHLDSLNARFGPRRGPVPVAYSFLLEAGGLRIGHSADLGSPVDLAPLFAKPLDLLVCELAHFELEEGLRYLNTQRIRRVVFVHLSRICWANLPRTRRLAAKLMPDIPHMFARDGQVISLRSKA